MSTRVVIGGRVAGVLLVVALLLPVPAAAQRPGGPFSGLFGRTPPRTGQEITRVEVRSSLGGQYDSVIPAGAIGPGGIPTGAVAVATTGLGYERRRDRLDLRGKGQATYQQFFQESRNGAPTYDLAAAMEARPASRFSVNASAHAVRSPYFQVSLAAPMPIPFMAMSVPGGPDGTRRMTNDAFDGEAGFTSQFTKRSSLGATVIRRDLRFLEVPGRNYAGWGGRADLRRRLSRGAIFRASYTVEQARPQQLNAVLYTHEMVDVGVDADRELSITRHTSLAFYTQSSILREPGGPRRFRLNGGLTLGHDFRRTWHAAMLVNRDTELHPGFVAPLFSDGVTLTLGGMPTARTEFTVNAGARRGQVGFDGAQQMNTQTATARLSIGLTTRTAIYTQYTYYRFEVPAASTVVEMLPRQARQQLSIGVTLWLPVYSQVRAPRDPR